MLVCVRRIVVLAVAYSLLGAVAHAKSTEKPTIAIFDFGLANTMTEKVDVSVTSGRGEETRRAQVKTSYETSLLTDKFVTALTKTNKVVVVERQRLSTVMQESQLSQAELTTPEKSVELGKLLGADYFLFGSLTMMDGNITTKTLPFNAGRRVEMDFVVGANIRIVETETGRVIAAESQKARNHTQQVNPARVPEKVPVEFQQEVFDKLVKNLVSASITALFPVKVAFFDNNVAYLNRGGLEKGATYEVVMLGREIRDPDTGELLGQSETKIALLEISEPLKKLSKARVVQWFGGEKKLPEGAICRQTDEEGEHGE